VESRKTDVGRRAWIALVTLGLAAFGRPLAFAGPAESGPVTPLRVPASLEVQPGHEAFLVGHATGTQNYVCLPSGSGFAWSLFTPAATLFDDDHHPIGTHYFGPNPTEDGTIRAAWESARDASLVWGRAIQSSTDPEFVEEGAIPWLLVNVKDVGAREGPTGGRDFTNTTFIQRVNTHGGAAPATGCGQSADVGHRAFVPYTADYVFYDRATRDGRRGH